MTKYDEFRKKFGNASPEEKLAIIRSESRRLLNSARGDSLLMNQLIEERKPPELPDDFGKWCQKVEESVKDLEDLIDALTDRKHRSIMREEQAERDNKFNETLWKHAQQGLPELQKYSSLRDALEKFAERLGILLLPPETKIKEHGNIVSFFGTERRALIGPQASQRDLHYLGYAITLKWLFDGRNLEWHEHEGLTQSLEEAVTVLHMWLVKNVGLDLIRQEYPWMGSGRIDRNF